MPDTPRTPLPPTAVPHLTGHEMRLGRRPMQQDARTLELGDYLLGGALVGKVPPQCDWTKKVASWPYLANDRLGDCVEAAMGHQEQLWSAADGGSFVPTPEQAIWSYELIAHYDPTNPSTDDGTILLAAMNFWRSTGFAGLQDHRIDAFASFPQHAPKKIMASIYLFGGAIIGVNLPLSAQSQINAGQSWTLVPGPSGQPGSWGGHCVPLVGYSPDGLSCVTWGRVQKMSWQWFATYCEEAYAPLSRDWAGPDGKAPNALNWAQLRNDLAAIKAM